jgi:3-oxoacyl-[acyl-carrier protein] reductase
MPQGRRCTARHKLTRSPVAANGSSAGAPIRRPKTQWAGHDEDGQQALVQRIAMQRLGSVQDIANAVVFFASDLAGFVNGQVPAADGGK